MRVRELMSTGMVTIEAAASCQQAVERMYRHKVRHLPVTGSDGTLVGIVTDRDLRHHLFAHHAFGATTAMSAAPSARRWSATSCRAR